MNFPHQMFKAYDIRGIVDAELSEALAEQLGLALGRQSCARGVTQMVVARDGRLSGERLQRALMHGLRQSGCDVVDIGAAPTPVLYFVAARCGGSGIAVTASHNPPQYNGLKMMIAGETLFGDAIQSLKAEVIDIGRGESGDQSHGESDGASNNKSHNKSESGNSNSDSASTNASTNTNDNTLGALRQHDGLGEYARALCADIRLPRPLRIAMDCGNGIAGAIAPRLFRELGCEVIELFCEVDGSFPNHHPDPSEPKNLVALIDAVRAQRAEFGIAFDGDGDRLGVVSGDGAIIQADRLMLLFIDEVLRESVGGEVLFDVKCSRLVGRAIAARGGRAKMCRTGHSFIKRELAAGDAVFAGEMSGHLFFADRWGGFDDGVYAAARLCALLGADARTPREVFAALPDTVNTPELRMEMREGEAHQLIETLIANAASAFADAEVSTLDGVRVDFADGFGLIRASNTTPTMIMRFEADTRAQLDEIQSRFRRFLTEARDGLTLPF